MTGNFGSMSETGKENADRQMERRMERGRDRWTGRWTDGQTDGQSSDTITGMAVTGIASMVRHEVVPSKPSLDQVCRAHTHLAHADPHAAALTPYSALWSGSLSAKQRHRRMDKVTPPVTLSFKDIPCCV